MLRLEARSAPSRAWSLGSPLLALAITVLIGVALFALLGKDPVKGLAVFFWEPIKSGYALGELMVKATPLLLIALGLAVCFRSNAWNIGAEGQFVMGAIAAGGVALLADAQTGRWIWLAVLVAGVFGGMVWAGLVALLRDRFNANEILVSLMLVYVAEMVLSYLVYGPWKDPAGYNFPQTRTFEAVTKIPRLMSGSRVTVGLPLFRGELPNKAYDTRSAQPVDYANQPAEIGFSALDLGRMLIWLAIVRERYPQHAAAVDAVVASWSFCGVLDTCGSLYGAVPTADGRVQYLQEGRLGYEEYAAVGFGLWGFDVARAAKPEPFAVADVSGVAVPHDARDPRELGAHNYVVTESAVLDGMELGWRAADGTPVPWRRDFADAIYAAQAARHRQTGILTARTEHQLAGAPYFVYDTVYADGFPWNTITDQGAYVPQYAAVAAKDAAAAMPGYERAALLRRAGALLVERAPRIAEVMARETGKAIKDAKAEVVRSQDTLTLSAEEAVRIEGEHVPLDASAMGAGKICFMLRFPVGVVAGITPFNAPFNLACHKVAPAIASGNVIVLKAPPQSPGVVHELARIFVDAGTPAGMLNVLYGDVVGPALVRDPRVDFVTFTGSSRVGAEIKAASGLRRVALELGGNGTTIVHEDADIAEAAPVCARNAMRLAGQSCISVQTVFAHRAVYDRFVETVVAEVKKLKAGDPLDPATDVGTLIDENAARRVEAWVNEAAQSGARGLAGGTRRGAQLDPTVLVDVDPSMKVVCEEVFGPVISILPYDDFDAVCRQINGSRYGLQCGVFTKSVALAIRAFRTIRTGGVIVNGSSTWRTDQLAYGGVKDSGIGREGPKYAIRDMTDERLVLFNL
jgi:acyl-CoA reductase-like NAD-dependent aldehyde dehydrogenase